MIINISKEIGGSLELNAAAIEFINKLNNYPEIEFVVDFNEVYFVSRTFAQAYYASKKRSPKKITEINLSNDVKPMMEMVERQIMF